MTRSSRRCGTPDRTRSRQGTWKHAASGRPSSACRARARTSPTTSARRIAASTSTATSTSGSPQELLGEQLPAPAAPHTRYWKIAAGEDAKLWETWRTGGFIAIGWPRVGDLTNLTHDEFKQRAQETDASPQVWKFRNIEVGDRVVANDGFFRVLGIGTVTGAYRFVHGERYPHQLPVRWDDTRERQVEMKGWRASLIRLNQDTFKEIEAAPIVDAITPGTVPSTTSQSSAATEVGPEGGLDFDGVLAQLVM
jgi:hypothetical protein